MLAKEGSRMHISSEAERFESMLKGHAVDSVWKTFESIEGLLDGIS